MMAACRRQRASLVLGPLLPESPIDILALEAFDEIPHLFHALGPAGLAVGQAGLDGLTNVDFMREVVPCGSFGQLVYQAPCFSLTVVDVMRFSSSAEYTCSAPTDAFGVRAILRD